METIQHDKKILKFLLTDNGDNFYTDLIEFKEPVLLSEVYKVINKCTFELAGTYTNEDIYRYLDALNVDYTITFLGDYETIYY